MVGSECILLKRIGQTVYIPRRALIIQPRHFAVHTSRSRALLASHDEAESVAGSGQPYHPVLMNVSRCLQAMRLQKRQGRAPKAPKKAGKPGKGRQARPKKGADLYEYEGGKGR
jgi:hypothetical protein